MAVLEADVIVVGAGPVGLTLANLLARYGVSTIVLERLPIWEGEPRAVALDDDGLRVLQAAGLHEHINERLLPDIVIRYVTRSGRCFLEIAPKSRPQGLTQIALFHQPWLEEDLRANVAASPHVRMLHEHEVMAFTVGEEGVEVTAARAGHELHCFRGRYLVGCDGARSTIRKGLGIEFRGMSSPDPWLVAECVDPTPHNGPGSVTTFYCRSADSALTVPLPSGLRRWEFLVPPGRDHAEFLSDENIASLIRGLGGEFTPIKRKGIYVAHARQAVRFQSGRVFLAGDAAHVTPPFAGQGLNSGLRDAANLARKLEAALAGRLSDDALETYDVERRRHVEEVTRMALNLGRLIMTANPLLTALRNGVLGTLNKLGPVQRFLRGNGLKSEFRIRSGIVHSSREGRHHVGRTIVQPLVTDASGATRLLDDAIGLRWALLGIGDTPDALLGSATVAVLAAIGIRERAMLTDQPPRPGVLAMASTDWAWFKGLSGHCLVIRPDRIIAAVITAESAPAALAMLRLALTPDARPEAPPRPAAAASVVVAHR